MDASDGTFDTYQTAWRLGRAPAPVQRATELIEAVTDYPDPGLFNDPVVYVGLRHVGKTLRYARSADAIIGLPEHMWKLAIRAEFGVLGTALQEMQEAQEALREGIARRASQREVDTLFARYNQAVDAYMEELRKNATIVEGNGEGGMQAMGSADEIQALLDAIEEANRIGDTEGARRALAQLAELLENMQMQLTQGGGGGDTSGEDEMSEEMRESLEDLAESLGEQRELDDQTRQAERDAIRREFGEEGSGESLSPQELSERQAEIEQLIEGLQRRLSEQGTEVMPGEGEGEGEESGGGEAGDTGEGQGQADGDRSGGGNGSGGIDSIQDLLNQSRDGDGQARGGTSGEAFSRARDAMRESQAALGQGELGRSRQAQSEAIQALRDAGDALAAERAGDGAEQNGDADPLGRGEDGFASDNAETDIDPRDNAERSREILEELRRRASEAEREQQEQDYLDRLLKRF
jgi:cytochrome c556